jgi:predicted metal-dependent peptidase
MTTIKDLEKIIHRARNHAILDIPMAQADAIKMDIFFTHSIPTAATDGKKIGFNPLFIASINEEEREFVVAHEWSHKFLKHISRAARLRDRFGSAWTPAHEDLINIAADEESDYLLEKVGFKILKGAYRSARFDDMCMEEIFQILLHEAEGQGEGKDEDSEQESREENKDSEKENQPGQPGNENSDNAQQDEEETGEEKGEEGQEEGEPEGEDAVAQDSPEGVQPDDGGNQADHRDGGFGSDKLDESQSVDPSALDDYKVPEVKTWGRIEIRDDMSASELRELEIEESIEQSNSIAISKLSGKLPRDVEQIVREVNSQSRVDWTTEMAEFISEACGEDSDTTWSRPNKRFASMDIYMPSNTQDGIGEIVVLRDSSGSMDENMYDLASNECFHLIKQSNPQTVHIVDFTTDIVASVTYENGFDEDNLPSRMSHGGTDVRVGFEWVEIFAPNATGIVVMSDMEFFRWPEDNGVPVLWVKIPPKQDYSWIFGKPSFGRMITVR